MFSGGEKNLNLNTAVIGNRASALESKSPYFLRPIKGTAGLKKLFVAQRRICILPMVAVNSLRCTPGKP
jgi:hypothetical protein